jgi:hypothetical protein
MAKKSNERIDWEPSLDWRRDAEQRWTAGSESAELDVTKLPNGEYRLRVTTRTDGAAREVVFKERENHFLVEAERQYQLLLAAPSGDRAKDGQAPSMAHDEKASKPHQPRKGRGADRPPAGHSD